METGAKEGHPGERREISLHIADTEGPVGRFAVETIPAETNGGLSFSNKLRKMR